MPASLRLSVVVCLLFAAACADQGPVVPDASVPLFAVTNCELAVSNDEARSQMDALLRQIGKLSGRLKSGLAKALLTHLENARRNVDSGKYCPALAQLKAFRDQVKSFVAARVLTDTEAAPLLAGIDVILNGRPAAPPPPPAPAPAPVASVLVAPTTPSIEVGQGVQLTATTRDASDNVLAGRTIAWSSSNDAVATVNTDGLVTSVSVGSATITATSESRSGSATVTVTPVPVASVTVAPATPSVVAGQTVQLAATTLDAGNSVLTGRVIVWSSSNDAVATVSNDGLVMGVSAGAATITATAENQSGSASVTVTVPPPPPAPREFVNPSFEADRVLANFYGAVPTGWSASGISSIDTDNFGGDVGPAASGGAFNFAHYVSQGTYGARLFTRTGLSPTGETIQRTFNAGEHVSLFQELDLTGVLSVTFDAQLRSVATTWRTAFVARVLIDGVTVWSSSVVGIQTNRVIDTSALTGVHTFEFRLEAVATNIVSGAPSMWFMFDNVRLAR